MGTITAQIEGLKTAAAEQTAASQALAQEVASKLGEIDKKVLEATAIVESLVSDKLNANFYVDQLGGDDSNDGTTRAPFKSLSEVNKRLIPGGVYTVTLLSDYRFDPALHPDNLNVFMPVRCTLHFISGGDVRRQVTFVPYFSGGSFLSARFDTSNGAVLSFHNLSFDFDGSALDTNPSITDRFVLISTNNGTSSSPTVNVRFRQCDFTAVLTNLPESGAFMETVNNFSVVVVSSCVLPAAPELAQKMILDATESQKITGSIYTTLTLKAE